MKKVELAIHELTCSTNVVLGVLAATVGISLLDNTFAPKFHRELFCIYTGMPDYTAENKEFSQLTLFPSGCTIIAFVLQIESVGCDGVLRFD